MENNKNIINKFYNNLIATNWKKLGEVYEHENGQTMFACFICLENATSEDSVYNTSDVSAFCWHIKQQHTYMLAPNEVVKETSAKKLSQVSVQIDKHYEIADSGDLKKPINEKPSTKQLELFHQNMVQKLTNDKIENTHHIPTAPNHTDTNIENDRNLKGNSVHLHTKVVDKNESAENRVAECDTTDSLNDMIEISDDDDDGDDKDLDVIEMSTDIQRFTSAIDSNYQANLLTCNQPFVVTENNHSSYSYPMDYSNHCSQAPEVSSYEILKEHQNTSTNTSFNTTGSNRVCHQHHAAFYQNDMEGQQNINVNAYGSNNTKTLRPFKCYLCGKRTSNEKAMQIHQKRYHTSESDFGTTQCEICQKPIYVPNLSLHMLAHSNKATFKCSYCGRYYKHKQSLHLHIKNKHSHYIHK